jgi:hypothetical protein
MRNQNRIRKRSAIALALAGLLLLVATPTAQAAAVHPDIQAVLDEVPGGVVVSFSEAYWPALDMAMVVPGSTLSRVAVGSCASGKICSYASANLSGTRLEWSSCATHSVPSSHVSRSFANARASGSIVNARNGTTVVASASAGNWKNLTATVTNFRCVE